MRKLALMIGAVMALSPVFGCVNDPTLDDSTMSATEIDTDSATVVEVLDTATETVVDSSTDTAE